MNLIFSNRHDTRGDSRKAKGQGLGLGSVKKNI
jgi:hypothetical protein